jgi:transcriptional regulator with XRE-family HTH domain
LARPPAPSRPLYLGPRIKRLRRELGLTQQAMAEEMGVSPSYIALIERNQRPLTADLLLRLAATYRLDMADLAAQERDDHARRLAEALRDPLFAEIDLPALEVADVATSYPGITEALLRLHGAHARASQALAEGREAHAATPASDPQGEARRFLAARGHWFATLEAEAEALASEIEAIGPATSDRPAEWLRTRGVRVRAMPASVMMGALSRYDRHNEQLLLDESLGPQRRLWQIGLHLAYTSLRTTIAQIVRGESFASATAAQLVRRALAERGAAAILMPYDRFARAAEAQAYDLDRWPGCSPSNGSMSRGASPRWPSPDRKACRSFRWKSTTRAMWCAAWTGRASLCGSGRQLSALEPSQRDAAARRNALPVARNAPWRALLLDCAHVRQPRRAGPSPIAGPSRWSAPPSMPSGSSMRAPLRPSRPRWARPAACASARSACRAPSRRSGARFCPMTIAGSPCRLCSARADCPSTTRCAGGPPPHCMGMIWGGSDPPRRRGGGSPQG